MVKAYIGFQVLEFGPLLLDLHLEDLLHLRLHLLHARGVLSLLLLHLGQRVAAGGRDGGYLKKLLRYFCISGTCIEYNESVRHNSSADSLALCLDFGCVVGRPREFPAAEVLVVYVVGDVLEVLHVRPDHHVAQRDEVAVLQILDW